MSQVSSLDEWTQSLVLDKGLGKGVATLQPAIEVAVSDADGDGVWVVSDAFSQVYGDGATPQAAIDDYVNSLADHFLWLIQHEPELAPVSIDELSQLRQRLHVVVTA